MLRRTKDEALDLPPKTRTWQPVDVTRPRSAALEARALDYLARNPARRAAPGARSWGSSTSPPHARRGQGPSRPRGRPRTDRGRREGRRVHGFTAVVDQLCAGALGRGGERSPAPRRRPNGRRRRRAPDRPAARVLLGNLQAAGVGLTLTAATHVVFNDLDWVPGNHWQAEDRIYRIGQTRPAFVTYLFAAGTLDDYVAALLEQKARNIGVLETAAAESASLVEQVVDAAVRGERPREPRRARQPCPGGQLTGRSGLLEDTLDLLARMRRGLASVDGPDERVFQVPSKSNPGTFNTVTVVQGVARCSCEGFAYRGNCSHAQRIASRLARGAA